MNIGAWCMRELKQKGKGTIARAVTCDFLMDRSTGAGAEFHHRFGQLERWCAAANMSFLGEVCIPLFETLAAKESKEDKHCQPIVAWMNSTRMAVENIVRPWKTNLEQLA